MRSPLARNVSRHVKVYGKSEPSSQAAFERYATDQPYFSHSKIFRLGRGYVIDALVIDGWRLGTAKYIMKLEYLFLAYRSDHPRIFNP